MRKILLVIAMISAFYSQSQQHYMIKYDKAHNSYNYHHIVKSTSTLSDTLDLKKLPKLNPGDAVEVVVFNYNPFLYAVDVEREDIVIEERSNNVLSVLGMMVTGLEPISGLLGNLSSSVNMFRDDSDISNPEEFDQYTAHVKKIEQLIANYNINVDFFSAVLEQLKSEDLHENKDATIKKLEKVLIDYHNPIEELNELVFEMNKAFYKAGITGNKYQKTKASLDISLDEFRKRLIWPDNLYTPEKLKDLIVNLRKTNFTTTKFFTFGEEIKTKSTSFKNNSGISEIRFTISFMHLADIYSSMKTDEEAYTYAKYYYNDAFYNAKGEIQEEPCVSCHPVLRAEGLFRGTPPRYFDDLLQEDGKMDDAVAGKWLFYSKEGDLEKIDSDPLVSRQSSFEKSLVLKNDLENIPAIKMVVNAPVSGGTKMTWTTGVYAIGAFGGRFEYESLLNSSSDSITISSSGLPNNRFSIGSQMAFDVYKGEVVIPSLNLGAAVDLWNDRDVHFLVGGGLKFTRFEYLSLSCGIAFTRVNHLNDEYEVNRTYDAATAFGGIYSKKYRPGYYFGININF
jgi:hypothetical protein